MVGVGVGVVLLVIAMTWFGFALGRRGWLLGTWEGGAELSLANLGVCLFRLGFVDELLFYTVDCERESTLATSLLCFFSSFPQSCSFPPFLNHTKGVLGLYMVPAYLFVSKDRLAGCRGLRGSPFWAFSPHAQRLGRLVAAFRPFYVSVVSFRMDIPSRKPVLSSCYSNLGFLSPLSCW